MPISTEQIDALAITARRAHGEAFERAKQKRPDGFTQEELRETAHHAWRAAVSAIVGGAP